MRRLLPTVSPRTTCARVLSAIAVAAALALTSISINAQIPGRNVNMVAGTTWPQGDPFLQRQNEPSIAASTRNPLHLLGGSNDYRTVDLPGLPGDEIGDAWLGLYKSWDGGQRWISTLLPGYPQDTTPAGNASPIKGYGAGADAVVRAGTNGLIYYAGLAFDRANPATPEIPGKSAIFVARFIDNNNKESGDTFAYLGTRAIQTDPGGSTNTFLDKPWIAVDIPRNNARCTIVTQGENGPITQRVPAGPVYVAYTRKTRDFLGDRYDTMFSWSTDCGNTWTTPLRISNFLDRANQGVTMAIDPRNGNVYLAWRRIDLIGSADAIMTKRFNYGTKRFDLEGIGRHFPATRRRLLDLIRFFTRGGLSRALAAQQLTPFDQGTSDINEFLAFRTNAYPTLTVDHNGRVYMAWAERGFDPNRPDPIIGDARIMMATSTNGRDWTDARAVSSEGQLGHQIMPTLTFAGGKLMLVYYDLRETSAQTFSQFIDDVTARPSGKRHTIDVRASMASPAANPFFQPSVRVSDYLEGPLTTGGPNEQLQHNPPNLPMFRQGTAPFIGDYIDVTAAPNFVLDSQGRWIYNTASTPTLPIFHAVWTDNRDVRAPRFDANGDGNPWNDYTPPGAPGGQPSLVDPTQTVGQCVAGFGNFGSRNQNVYTARITGGLLAGSPGNTKTLSTNLQRSFVVFVQNSATTQKTFELSIASQPVGGRASFEQFPLPPYNAQSPPPLTRIRAIVPRKSTVSRTVYVTSSDPHARLSINVTEVNGLTGGPVTGGLGSSVILNPDIDNPDIDNPDIDNPDIDNPDIDNLEVYNPDIDNPDIDNPDIDNPDIDNPDIDNPDIDNIRVANPDIDNPDIDNPDIDNPDIDNPDIDNPDIDNPDIDNQSLMTDVSWEVTNTGNTTAAYNINLFFAQTNFEAEIKTQLVLHRVYKTPVGRDCLLKTETRNIVVANIPNPQLIAAGTGQVTNPNDPGANNATIHLAPGESAKITLRIFDPDRTNTPLTEVISNGELTFIPSAFVPNENVTPVVQQQSVNTEDARGGETEPPIVTPTGSNLLFLQQPSNTAVNTPIAPAVRVRAFDNSGGALAGVTVSMSLNAPGVVVNGGVAVTDAAGIATFGTLQIGTPGNGYILTASAGGSVPATAQSAPFNVVQPVLNADLEVSQSFAQPIINTNTPITLTVANAGPAPATGVVLTNTLPVAADFISVSDASCVHNPDLRTVTCAVGTLAPGTSRDYTIVIRPTAITTLTNAVSIAGAQPDPNAGDNLTSATTFVSTYAPCASPTFSGPFIHALNTQSTGIVTTADFNEDGFADLFIAEADGNFVLLLSDGQGGYAEPQYLEEQNPQAATAADFNNDGHADLAGISSNDPPGQNLAEFGAQVGDGAGNFTSSTEDILLPLAAAFAIENGDFNEDGNPDVVVSSANVNDNTIVVLLGVGDGSFNPPISVPAGPTPGNLVLGDFNVDGHLDIAVNNIGFPTISIMRGNGEGGFSAPQVVNLPVNSGRLRRMNDVNGDGAPDLAVTTNPGGGVPGSLLLLLNDGAGNFPTATEIIGPRGVGFATTSDLNGDGRLDVAAIVFPENRVVVLEGDGTGLFTETASYPIGPNQNNFVITDLNVDGRPDIAGTVRGGYYLLINTCAGGQGASADLASTVLGPENATVDAQLTYTAFVANNGPDPATNVVATFVVPTGMNFISSSIDCTVLYGTVQCNLPTIAPDANASFTVTVRAFAAGVRVTRLIATATAADPEANNNAGSATTTIAPGAFTFIVTNTADAGPGSLRQAIQDSNLNAGSTNQIHFNIPGAAPFVISPQSGLGNITVPVIIDGTTQPGYDGVPVIELTGINLGNTNGLNVNAGGSTVRGLSITRWLASGINLSTNGNSVVEGNYIGLTPAGVVAGNGTGVNVIAPNNRVGGTTPAARNVISGNTNTGVHIGAQVTNGVPVNTGAGTIVLGNYIGLGPDGITARPNGQNGLVVTAPNVTIGGALVAARNIISGNQSSAMFVGASLADPDGNGPLPVGPLTPPVVGADIVIRNNYIGTDVTGTIAVPNAQGGLNVSAPRATVDNNLISGNTRTGLSFGTHSDATTGQLFASGDHGVAIGNRIGVAANGNSPLPNTVNGISISALDVAIGGNLVSYRNIIAGNGQHGISINAQNGQTTANNRVIGNYIGTVDGSTATPNGAYGVDLSAAIGGTVSGNTIGGSSPSEGNVISGNGLSGVAFRGAGTTGNTVTGNRIGTNASGLGPLPNASYGVFFGDAVNNTVGPDNLIAFNTRSGVTVSGTGNRIESNSIHSNTILGIDLGGNDTVDPNDAGDGDGGANNRQNFPVLSNASNAHGATTRVDVNLTSFANGQYTLQFFANAACDPSGHGEGQRLIGHFTGHSAPATSQLFMNEAVPPGEFITATATDGQGNTSEFSQCNVVVGGGSAAPDRVAFLGQPSSTTAGVSIAPPVQVAIQDATGATVTTATDAVTIGIGANPGGGGLFGTLTRNAINGIATFDNLAINSPGNGYTLVASSGSLAAATSLPFNIQPSVFIVTTTADSGPGSLRQAMLDANGRPVATSIVRFNLAGQPPHTITPQSPLPGIAAAMIIDGTAGGVCTGAPPTVVLNGVSAGLGAHGLLVNSPGVAIRGLAIGGFAQSGIFLAGGGNNLVECNYLGVAPDGVSAIPNQDGVRISGSSSNTVGGATASVRNVISGNSSNGVLVGTGVLNTVQGNYIGTNPVGDSAVPNGTGIFITGLQAQIMDNVVSGNATGMTIAGGVTNAVVTGNRVGTDHSGTIAVPNADGISIGNASGNTLGGITAGARNLISGNTNVGLGIIGANAHGNTVLGNYIGTTGNGLSALPNGFGVDVNAAPNNRFGGTVAGARNIISGNTSLGLELEGAGSSGNVVEGNFIGVNAAGTALANGGPGIQIIDASSNTIGGATSVSGNTIAFNGSSGVRLQQAVDTPINNRILSNSIHSNAFWGIDLGLIPINDAGDADTGPNNLQNYPLVASASAASVSGSLGSAPSQDFTVQLFENAVCDPSGYGEGQTRIDSFLVTTDANGNVSFARSGFSLVSGRFVTATATDASGNTSAFSACTQVNPSVTLTPNPFAIVTNTSAPMTVALSRPAGVGGQAVNFVSNDPAAQVQEAILIPEGASAGTATITTGAATGSAIITATAAGFQDGTATVNVSLRGMTLSAPSALVGVGRSLTGTITLAQPAPTGGLAVNLVSGDTNFVTVSPPSVTIAQGATTGTFTINGIASGSSTITATATGASNATLLITATTSSLISMGNPPTVAPGQSSGVAVSLGIDAPPGGVTISFVSSDTNVATITPSVFIPAGLRIPAANPQITGVTPGTASITASAAGFAPDTKGVTVTLTLSFTPATNFAVIADRTSNITLNLSSPAPAGGLTLNTSIDNTAFATVPSTVFVGAGLTSVAVPVTGVAVGNTTVRASGTGIAQVSAPVRVDPTPGINIGNLTIGKDLQSSHSGSLGLAAPAGGVVVTITSLDPSRVLLATADNVAGSASITRTVGAGATFIPSFWVHALAGTGTSDIQATATGYANDSSTITMQPSGFILNVGNFTTNTGAPNTALRVDAAQLAPGSFAYLQSQPVRGGLTVNVAVTSSNTTVGTIVGSPLTFGGGDLALFSAAFDPATIGSSTIALTTPAGFSTPNNLQSIVATVVQPTITVGDQTLGKDLQSSMSGSIGAPAPPGNLIVTITSLDASRVLLANNSTSAGSASINVQVNAGTSTIPSFWVHALAGTGSAQFQTSAPGYATDTSTVTLQPSGFILNMGNINTNTFAANQTIRVDAALLHPTTLAYTQSQPLRGGLTVNVPVSSSNTNVGTIVGGPAVFNADVLANFGTAFDPVASGTTTISLTTPAGFTTPSNLQSITATVTAPNISIGSATVGRDLQTSLFVSLAATPPSPVTVTVTSNNGTIATITRDGNLTGGTSLTFTNVTTTSVGTIFVQGRGLGSTTLTVQAAGYNDGTSNITVDPSGFILNMGNINTNTFAPNQTIRVDASLLHPTTLAYAQSQSVRGGLTVNVPVTSSDTNVGTIVGSPAVFNAGDVANFATFFDPATSGTSTVSLTTPAGFTTPSNLQSITATVTAPNISIGSATVGRDLQTSLFVSLAATPPSPVTVTVTSNNGTIATITRDGNLTGGTSLTFTNVTTTSVGTIFVQGRGLGSTTLTVQAAGYNDGTSNITVDPSGFILNIGNISTNTFAANQTIRVDASLLHPTTLNYVQSQSVRGGLTVNVPVASSDTNVGTIVGSPAVFNAGDLANFATFFDPVAFGTSTISIATPPGFTTPSNFQSFTATVTAPTISINSATVGRDLQVGLSIFLQSPPPSPVTVTVTSNNGTIATITTDGNVAGGTSVTFTNVTTTTVGTIFAQGRALGNTTITVTAPGYVNGVSNITVDPSGFILNMGNFTTNASAANTTLRVDAALLNPATLNYAQSQSLRGGITANVMVSSSNTAVGTIVGSPAVFNPGDLANFATFFDPATSGTSTVSLTTPVGFTTPSNLQSITATVNP